jgi:hypothetical protein
MSKIYVFGIGGTGSRVLRALTMLLASGVECAADTIVPIIIDPDAAAGDVERTVSLMRQYSQIRSKLNFDTTTKNRFFKTNIMESMDSFRLPLSNTQDVLFDDYMGVSEMSYENQALVNILFSHKNLASDMTVGFKGNPNVGSVVLNQFDESYQFQNFANEFTANDKIFIISSIFGGTGASGFPLLLKTLRTNENIANQNLVHNAHIGAVTVLPYFQVKQEDSSQIDSATFVSKARSALAYYERNISRNNEIDTLYYVADDTRTTYENFEGGTKQKNNAHFVELAAAMSLIDFANSKKPETSVHKEFGISKDTNEIVFDDLGSIMKSQLRKPMAQFNLFSKYLLENSDLSFISQPWAKDRSIDKTFFHGDFINTLKRLQQGYIDWLKEMETQQRAFTPFNIHNNSNKVFDLVKGIAPKKLFTTLDSNFKLFDNRLSKQTSVKTGEREFQLLEIFYLATQHLVEEKFNIV